MRRRGGFLVGFRRIFNHFTLIFFICNKKTAMTEIFISDIKINNVRHLKGIEIPISTEKRKHLILTGKNGSGKTNVEHLIPHKGDIDLKFDWGNLCLVCYHCNNLKSSIYNDILSNKRKISSHRAI
jgi:HNH endonuclease